MILKDTINNRPRLTDMPDDYKTNSPMLFVFGVGRDENPANPSSDTLNMMYFNGSPFNLPKSAVNPVTKKVQTFAVMGVQGQGGSSPNAWEIIAATKDIIAKYNIDKRFVFITGLSAGGQLVLDVLGQDTDHIFAAGVPLSCPGTATSDWSGLTAKVWAFHGALDTGLTDYKYSVGVVQAIEAKHHGFASLVTIPNTPHCCWDKVYNGKFPVPGWADNLSVIEFCMLVASKPEFLFTSTGVAAATPVQQQPAQSGAPVAKIPLAPVVSLTAKDGLIFLDGSQSTGDPGAVSWGFTGPKNNGSYVEGGGDAANYATKKKLITNKVAGDYSITLTAYGRDNVNKSATQVITLDATGNTPPTQPVDIRILFISFQVAGKTVNVYTDKSYTIV
jgi:Prolyl oligopeptidase family